MKIEYTLPFRRTPTRPTLSCESTAEPQARASRIARLVALAHNLDELVRSDAVSDYGALARLGHISPARLTQIITLLHLSPAIQEYLLFLPSTDTRFMSELKLRTIAREPLWGQQHTMFERLLQPHK